MNLFRTLVFLITTILTIAPIYGNSIDQLFANAAFRNVKLSPDGSHVAFSYEEGTEVKLAVMNLKKKQILSSFGFGENMHVVSFSWGNNERVLMTVAEVTGSLDRVKDVGFQVAANIDGSKRFEVAKASDTMIRMDPRNDRFVYMLRSRGNTRKLFRVDIYNGKEDYIEDQPKVERLAQVVIDETGQTRIGIEYLSKPNGYESAEIALHIKKSSGWNRVSLPQQSENGQLSLLGLTPDNKSFVFYSNHESKGLEAGAAYQFEMESETFSKISENKTFTTVGLDYSHNGGLLSVTNSESRNNITYLNHSDGITKLMKGLRAAFSDENVFITSYNADGSQASILVTGDKNPGEFYLVDVKAAKVSHFASRLPTVDKNQLVDVKPITITTRDGLLLHGFVSMPKGKTNAPMIINPHGGPFGATDDWGYDPEMQWFAQNGYATLKINFRGSGGRGLAFQRAGYLKWGKEMQDDITDATLWAIETGLTNKDSVCIYGSSYGGYATLRGLQKEPDLYQCGFGYVGVYDLPGFFRTDKSPNASIGVEDYLNTAVAKSKEDMVALSPAHNVEKIKADLYLAHGRNDVRVTMHHYDTLVSALEAKKIPFKSMVKDEGHGYYKMENKKELYQEMITFFDKNLK